jgi:hypothetical protein
MNIGILGLGEVGQAIKKLCAQKHRVFCRDLKFDEIKRQKIDFLHVCIPYSQDFEKIVTKTIKELKPQLTIIDSTVAPGTTQNLYKKTKSLLAHCPILGKHPHLYRYQKIFQKPIGAINQKAYALTKKHFQELGVKTARFDSPFESELAKLLETTYYSFNIVFEKWVHEICRQKKANFHQVYTTFNQIYNQGYKKTLPNVIRPILKHQPGPIGGHCLIPNVKILRSWLNKDGFLTFILQQNERAKGES